MDSQWSSLIVMVVSWKLEDKKWQLPERIGLGIVLLSIPLVLP